MLGADRFTIDVEAVALEMSQQWCPRSPITKVEGHGDLGRFEGALQQHPKGKYWRIKFNADRRPSRARFTIAHEFGHYALHRDLRTSFECSESDVSGRTEIDIERDADAFASTLLMPLDDLRRQIDGQRFDFELVKHCADRYGVSLTAAARQCAEVSEQRVVVAFARDGADTESSVYDDADRVAGIINAGAPGFVSKKSGFDELIRAVKAVNNGEKFICVETSGRLKNLNQFLSGIESNLRGKEELFSQREREVIELLAQGKSSREIAEQLFITERTVESQRKNMIEKGQVKNTVELIAYASALGLVKKSCIEYHKIKSPS